MLRPPSSRTPWPGVWRERECPRCHRPVELPLGQLCPACRRAIEARARRIARLVAAVTTLGVGVWVVLRVPPDPTARLVGGMGIAIWYLLTNLVLRRALRELLR